MCLRLSTFCPRLLAFVCVFAFAFVEFCRRLSAGLHLLAFAYAPFYCPPPLRASDCGLAHRNHSDLCDCDAHRGPQKSPALSATLHCDLRVRWKVASDLRFRVAISEPNTPSFCGISGDLAPSMRKSLAIAIVRFWRAKDYSDTTCTHGAQKIEKIGQVFSELLFLETWFAGL